MKKVKFLVRNKKQLYLGTKLFNMSPNELQVINTYKVTKSKIKKYIFSNFIKALRSYTYNSIQSLK